MSLLLAQCGARGPHPPLEVRLVTAASDLDALYRLRHQIYVRELGVIAPDHPAVVGERMVDSFDAYSVNILLRAGGEPAGSVRLTCAADGPLEISRYTSLEGRCPDLSSALEVTRFMIRRDLRGSAASGLLLYSAWRVIRQRARYIIGAAKQGGLGRYYKHICAAGLTVFPETFAYDSYGRNYELIVADTGTPLSPRRVAWRGWIELLALAAFRTPFTEMAFVRGARRARLPAAAHRPRTA